MTTNDIRKYAELHEEIRRETERILALTDAKDCDEETFVDHFEVSADRVSVTWSDTKTYEMRTAEFPISYYAMGDEELVAAWKADSTKTV